MAFEITPALFFAVSIFVAVMAGVLVSGFLPPSTMPAGWWTNARKALVTACATLALLLIAAAVRLAILHLPWAVAVIAAGLAAITAPPVFQLLPATIRNTPRGLALCAPILAALNVMVAFAV
jgi:hypothetical protein